MARNKKSFVLYCDLINTVKKLPDDKAGELFKIILDYVNDNDPEVDDLLLDVTFEPIKQQLKRDLQKYEDKRKQWSEAGKRSAKKRKEKATTVNDRSTDSTVNDNVNVTVNVKESVENPHTKFTSWFNTRRKAYLELPSNFKRLSYQDKKNLDELTENYDIKDFETVIVNMCNDKWCNENNRIVPQHFLEHFENYLAKEQKPLIKKQSKLMKGWAIK